MDSGTSTEKSMKELGKLRSEFDAFGVLTSEEMINFVLVPCGRIDFHKGVHLENRSEDSARQWKITVDTGLKRHTGIDY